VPSLLDFCPRARFVCATFPCGPAALAGNGHRGVTMRKRIAALIAAGAISLATIPARAQPLPTKLQPGWRYPCSFCMYTWRGGEPYRTGGYNGPVRATRSARAARAWCSGPACVRQKRKAR
jgi:hypothetical protein